MICFYIQVCVNGLAEPVGQVHLVPFASFVIVKTGQLVLYKGLSRGDFTLIDVTEERILSVVALVKCI